MRARNLCLALGRSVVDPAGDHLRPPDAAVPYKAVPRYPEQTGGLSEQHKAQQHSQALSISTRQVVSE